MTELQRFHVELRAEVTGNKLQGHASVFGQMARIGATYEQLARSAFDAVLKDKATDVRALWNHDPNHLLGRQSSGTLRVGTDSEGLEFEVDLPDTSLGRDLRVLAERGDITGASFGFIPGEDEWDKAPDGLRLRTHTSVAMLRDVSPVTFPAYEGAAVSLRSMEFGRPGRVRSQLVQARARVHLGRV
jgi:HK97 family phage prohead protease